MVTRNAGNTGSAGPQVQAFGLALAGKFRVLFFRGLSQRCLLASCLRMCRCGPLPEVLQGMFFCL